MTENRPISIEISYKKKNSLLLILNLTALVAQGHKFPNNVPHTLRQPEALRRHVLARMARPDAGIPTIFVGALGGRGGRRAVDFHPTVGTGVWDREWELGAVDAGR